MASNLTNDTATEDGDVQLSTGRESKGAKAKRLIGLDSQILGDVEVRLSAILGQGTMTVGKLLALADGDVVDLDTPLDGRVDLMLNGKLIARGEIVAVDDHFGVRITQFVAEKA